MMRAKKHLGQNFIRNKALAEKIVRQLAIGAGDQVIEIGPGEGALTKIILEQYAGLGISLLAVEKDQRPIAQLRALERAEWYQVQNADVLRIDFSVLCDSPRPVKVIGNIPYYITSDIVLMLVAASQRVARAVFTVQKEYAERLAAVAGSKTYARLTVIVNTFFEVERCFDISRHVFVPRPKVDSAVIALSPCPITGARKTVADNRKMYEDFVRHAFSSRRKKLVKNLRAFALVGADVSGVEQFLSENGFSLAARAEDLSVDHFIALFESIIYRKD